MERESYDEQLARSLIFDHAGYWRAIRRINFDRWQIVLPIREEFEHRCAARVGLAAKQLGAMLIWQTYEQAALYRDVISKTLGRLLR